MDAQATTIRIPLRARLPWFAVWVPAFLLLYLLVNGAGHMLPLYAVILKYSLPLTSLSRPFWKLQQIAEVLFGPWGILASPVLLIYAYVSWKLCPQWSLAVRRACRTVSALLLLLLSLCQSILIFPEGYPTGTPDWEQLRIIAAWTWTPHASGITTRLEMRCSLRSMDGETPVQPIMRVPDLLTHGNVHVRIGAAEYLAGYRGGLHVKKYSSEIAKLLSDPNAEVRSAAVSALGSLEAKQFAPVIAKLLADDPDPEVHDACKIALARHAAHTQSPDD